MGAQHTGAEPGRTLEGPPRDGHDVMSEDGHDDHPGALPSDKAGAHEGGLTHAKGERGGSTNCPITRTRIRTWCGAPAGRLCNYAGGAAVSGVPCRAAGDGWLTRI